MKSRAAHPSTLGLHPLVVGLGLALHGCEPKVAAPEVPSIDAPAPPASPAAEAIAAPPVEPSVLAVDPELEPPERLPPGLAARVDPTPRVTPSPYLPRLDELLATAPTEPVVSEAEAGDAAAWTKAGRQAFARKRYAAAIHAFAQAAKLEPAQWKHPLELARAAVQAGDEETAKLALAHSYLLDIGQASDAAWHKDFAPIWNQRWFRKLGLGELSEVLGNAPDWQPHGLRLHTITVRFMKHEPLDLQIHARADVVEAERERDRVVWATSCKQGDRVYTELGSMGRSFKLDFEKSGAWQRPAAIGYTPSLSLTSEPDACEFRIYRVATPVESEPLASPPVWMADSCWTRGKPFEAGIAREGRCGFAPAAGPDAAFAVESVDVTAATVRGKWSVEQTFDLVLGRDVGSWKTIAVDTSCRCAAGKCKKTEGSDGKLRDQNLWFVRAGEHVRLRDITTFASDQGVEHCQIEIGTRGPHRWGDEQQWTLDLDVVARYCHRDGTTSEGACG